MQKFPFAACYISTAEVACTLLYSD